MFSRVFTKIKSLPHKFTSVFNKRMNTNEGYNPSLYQQYQQEQPYNEYATYSEPVMQEPLTMASAREMSRQSNRRRQTVPTQEQNNMNEYVQDTSQQAPYFNSTANPMMQNNMQYAPMPQGMPMQDAYQSIKMQEQFTNMPMQEPNVPTMRGNTYPMMNEPQGFSVERNPLLDVNIAVYVLLKPDDCHEMLKGIINPSLYIINMENMVDESSIKYCKHVLMGAKLVLNYTIKRISSRNIYVLCPAQINIKMDEAARSLISRYETEPRQYQNDSAFRNERHEEFGF